MRKTVTIWEAAVSALEALGGSGTVSEIYEVIVSEKIYDFGVSNPEDAPHVLDTEMKRKCANSARKDARGSCLFELNYDVYNLISQPKNDMNAKKASGTKRIHRAKDKEAVITAMMGENVGVFKEIWRLLIFSAQVGLQDRRREQLRSVDAGKGIDQTTFGNSPSWPGICYLMGLVEENSSDILSGTAEAEDLRIAIFQEYANGGLSILKDYFQDRNIDLDGLLSFIDERSKKPGQAVNLDLSI